MEVLFPAQYSSNVPFMWGSMYDISPTDTTSTSAWRAHFSSMHILPYSQWHSDSGYGSIVEMAPYDLVRIFVYNGSYHYDKYTSPTDVFESECYYCRYDLTRKSLEDLTNEDGNIVITFHPDERMQGVKMWPPYEEVVAKYGDLALLSKDM